MVNLSLVHSLYFLWDFLCLISKIPCLGENEELNGGGGVGVKTQKVILTNFLAISAKLEQLWFVHYWTLSIFWGGGVNKNYLLFLTNFPAISATLEELWFFFIFQTIFFSVHYLFFRGGVKNDDFIFLLVGSIVVGMPNFSFLEGLEVGFLWRKKTTKNKKQQQFLGFKSYLSFS